MEANVGEVVRRIVCATHPQSDTCTKWTALDGMSFFGPGIRDLGKLPPASLPCTLSPGMRPSSRRCGGLTITCRCSATGSCPCGRRWTIWASAPDGGTIRSIRSRTRRSRATCGHLWLKRNLQVQQLVYSYIDAYVQAHPPAPVLGGDAFWLADGGKWHVHGESLQISQGPSGLTGTVSWNAGPCNGPYNNNPSAAGEMCEGSSQLTFASQPDGSLAGTFTTNPAYTAWSGGSIGNFQPSSGDPKAGRLHAGAAPGSFREERARHVRRRQPLPVPGRYRRDSRSELRRLAVPRRASRSVPERGARPVLTY